MACGTPSSPYRVGTGDFFKHWARTFVSAGDAEREALLGCMRRDAREEDRPDFPFNAGVALRELEQRALAAGVFEVGLEFPWSRAGSLFELACIALQDNEPERAVDILRRMASEGPLTAYQHQEFAHRLILVGLLDEADEHLESALALEPERLRECLAYRQLAEYMSEYPLEVALARSERLLAAYRFHTAEDIVAEVACRLEEKRPYSLIRLNDGEGSLLHLGVADEARWHPLYWRSRREFHVTYWFGDDSRMLDPEWLRIAREFNAAVNNADCLAGYMPSGLQLVYESGSVRNVPGCFNVVRKLEALAEQARGGQTSAVLADSLVNQEMRRSGALARLIGSQRRIALVTWNPALPDAMAEHFGLSEVVFHQTTGEARTVPGSETKNHAEAHRQLSEALSEAEPGLLYLVGGGIPGKVYCDVIKRAGGVALDIGGVVDVWMDTSKHQHEDLTGQRLV